MGGNYSLGEKGLDMLFTFAGAGLWALGGYLFSVHRSRPDQQRTRKGEQLSLMVVSCWVAGTVLIGISVQA